MCIAQEKISFHFEDFPVSTALDSIRSEYNIYIIYQDIHLHGVTISASCNDCNEHEALSALLQNTTLIWQKVDEQYIVSKSESKKKLGTISGFIRENATGEPITYANVYLKYTRLGNVSNHDGYYVISDIRPGEDTLVVSFMGYESKIIPIVLGSGQNLRSDQRLVKVPIQGDEIIVSAERQKFLDMVEPSQITLDVREVSAMPAFIEADIFRAIQLLPGVHTLNDFTSALYVRGGTPDQNLILLDGINVYHPFHMGGIFSTFNTDAIKEAAFRSGGFPVKYGGRMGSVLIIKNREGNTEEITGKANISLLSSKAMIEGPLPAYGGVKGSWMFAGRRTYFDKIIKTGLNIADYFNRDNPNWDQDLPGFPYYFYDLEGKINLDLNDNHRVTLGSYYGDDIFKMDYRQKNNWIATENGMTYGQIDTTTDYYNWRWGNYINSITWRWLVSPKLVLKTFVANSRFRFEIDMDFTRRGSNINGLDTLYDRRSDRFNAFDIINDKTIESELTWIPNAHHTITTGFQHKQIDFDLGVYNQTGRMQESEYVVVTDTSLSITHRPYEQSVYIQDKWNISTKFTTQSGVRLYRYGSHDTLYFEPRIAAKYFVNKKTAIKISVGRYHQFLTIVNPPDMNFAYVDLWMPIPKDRVASWSNHYVFGAEYMSDENILFRAEFYVKSFQNLLTLTDNGLVIQPYGETITIDPFNEFWTTKARAHGIELLLKKQTGKIRGWIGYTYSSVEKKTPKYNWYHPNYDRTNSLNIVGDWQWTTNTHISLAVTYMSGNPYTPILGKTESLSNTWGTPNWNHGYLLGQRNSARYPAYFRCDIGFSKRKKTKHGYQEWYLDILNATNHMNVLMYFYSYSDLELKGLGDTGKKNPGMYRFAVPMFPITPTFGWRYEF